MSTSTQERRLAEVRQRSTQDRQRGRRAVLGAAAAAAAAAVLAVLALAGGLLDRDDRLVVLLGDRSIDVPGWLRPALEEVRVRRDLRPSDLADHLDPRSRLVLCRRLVREGLLEVVR